MVTKGKEDKPVENMDEENKVEEQSQTKTRREKREKSQGEADKEQK